MVVTNAAPEVYGSFDFGDDGVFARFDGKVRPEVWCIQAAKEALVERRGAAGFAEYHRGGAGVG